MATRHADSEKRATPASNVCPCAPSTYTAPRPKRAYPLTASLKTLAGSRENSPHRERDVGRPHPNAITAWKTPRTGPQTVGAVTNEGFRTVALRLAPPGSRQVPLRRRRGIGGRRCRAVGSHSAASKRSCLGPGGYIHPRGETVETRFRTITSYWTKDVVEPACACQDQQLDGLHTVFGCITVQLYACKRALDRI